MKKIICLVLLLMSISIFASCIEVTEDIRLDDDNESCFIITEDDVTFDCDNYEICSDGGDTCITIDAQGVEIKDCIIEGDEDETAIRINEDEAIITQCVVDNADTAVYLDNSEDSKIEDIEISNCDKGIYIKSSEGTEVDNADITDTENGISISSTEDVELKDVVVENEDYKYYYVRFFITDEDEDPIEAAEITLEASEGSNPFNNEETNEDGYTEWKRIDVIEYGDETIEIIFNLTVEYEDEVYEEEDFDISKTETFEIELEIDVEEQEDLVQLNEPCTDNDQCASGYCCLQGDYRFTCKSGPAFCPSYDCTEDKDCDDDEECDDHECIKITGTCGYADDHKWIDYECCENSDCDDDEECDDNECVRVECECGEVKNHECIAECCDVNDCPEGYKCVDMVCLAGNACSSDSECKNTESCLGGFCEEVIGTCGYAFNHKWIHYECCLDSDCTEGKVCEESVCVEKQGENTGGICASAFIILSIFGLYIKRD